MVRASFLALILAQFLCLPAQAGVEQLGEKEFRKLAADLAPKVTLFQAVWEQDPNAEFYGGTSRDFLYWIKGKFQGAKTPAEAKKIAEELRALPFIDVRSFIIGDSDVDIVSKSALALNGPDYGVRKIDSQPSDIFDPRSEAGFNELNQGYAPAEKIRLSQKGIIPNPGLGEGAHEIYSGKLTVHFADPKKFAQTKYAKEGINHPVLLALRYVRLSAINYFREHGEGLPDRAKLFASLDPASAEAVKRVISEATAADLTPYFAQDKFKSWVNGAIQKAFRSYTNPTAALELMKHFSVDTFVRRHSDHVQPINQYVFAKYRDPAKIAENFRRAGVDPEKAFTDVSKEFPDGFFYHGTKTEPAFRGILFQGVLPSEHGSAQGGLYGVPRQNLGFAEAWSKDKNLVVKFPLKPDTKIMNIKEGVGKVLWEKWGKPDDFDGFAEAYGVDILRYPYDETDLAYVVKNGAALGPGAGVHREILPLEKILARAETQITEPKELLSLLELNSLTPGEGKIVLQHAKIPEKAFGELLKTTNEDWVIRAINRHFIAGSEDRMVEANLRDPFRFLESLEQNNFTFEQAERIRARTKLPLSAFTNLLKSNPEKEPQLAERLARYVVPAGKSRATLAFLNRILKGSNARLAASLVKSAFSSPAWEKEEEIFLQSVRALPSGWDTSVGFAFLDHGLWEKKPDLFYRFMGQAPFLTQKDIAIHLNESGEGWSKFPRLFPALLERAFAETGFEPNALRYQLGVAVNSASFAQKPELFLELNLRFSREEDPGWDWQNLEKTSRSAESPLAKHPYLQKLNGGNLDRHALAEAWKKERLKPKVQARLRALGLIAEPAPAVPMIGGETCSQKFGGL